MKQLRRIPFFATLSDAELENIGQRLQRRHCRAGELIVPEGAPGEALYLVDSGLVRLVSDAATEAAVFAHLGEGDFFGETALLTGRPHVAAVRAASDTDLWVLKKADFEALLATNPAISLAISRVLSQRLTRVDRKLVTQHLRKMLLFAGLSDDDLATIAKKLHPLQVKEGQLIFAEGEPGDNLYLIESGQVLVVSDAATEREIIARLSEGEFFGEMALLSGEPRSAAVRAVTAANLWVIGKADFEEIVTTYSPVGLTLSRVLSQRLEQTERHLVEHAAREQVRPVPVVTAPVVEERPPFLAPTPAPVPKPAAVPTPAPALKPMVVPAPAPAPMLAAVPTLAPAPKPVAVPKPAPTPKPAVIARPRPVRPPLLAGLKSWFGGLSRGAQLRLALTLALVAWLLVVAIPATIIAAASAPRGPVLDREGVVTEPAARGLNLVGFMARATNTPLPEPSEPPLPTYTPTPTRTPTLPPTPTPLPTATPVPATITPTKAPPTPTRRPPTATPVPATPTPIPEPIVWDSRLDNLGVKLVSFGGTGTYFKLVKAVWEDVPEAGGNHNIYVTILDENNNRLTGQIPIIEWEGGSQVFNPMDEKKAGDMSSCNFDFPMYGGSYSVRIQGQSDVVAGCRMPLKQHVNYRLTFKRVTR